MNEMLVGSIVLMTRLARLSPVRGDVYEGAAVAIRHASSTVPAW
jgi:hypothetical protein